MAIMRYARLGRTSKRDGNAFR